MSNPTKHSRAVLRYRKAALLGDADAQLHLARCYEQGNGIGKDLGESLKWRLKSARQGNPAAQCDLGYNYRLGIGVDRDDVRSVTWFRKAAKQGYAAAQYCKHARSQLNVRAEIVTLD